MKTFKQGDTVYSLHGEGASYIMLLSNGHLVAPLYQDAEDGGYYEDQPQTWREVFAKPPVAVLETAVQELQTKKESLSKEVADLRKQVWEAQKENTARLAELTKYEPLRFVEDYLNGKISHLVVLSGYNEDCVEVGPIGTFRDFDATQEYEGGKYEHPIRLLCLYGAQKTKGLEWRLHRYARGSGGDSYSVFPFTSEEQATAKAHSLMADILEKTVRDSDLESRIKNAKKIGYPVSKVLMARLLAYRRTDKLEAVKRTEDALAKAKASLAAFDAKQSEEVPA